jgi:outer membrane protein assembly factor BamB
MKTQFLALLAGCVAALVSARADYPSYAGANGAFAGQANVALMDDISQAKFVWESEEQRVGYGKTTTGGVSGEFGDLPPAGVASPIVADGAVILSYFSPSGDVVDAGFRERDKNRDATGQRYKVSADDVVLAIESKTGKTRWKFVAEGKGMSIPMGKREGWGITPAAANGRVFAIGTTGRVYALDLKSGKLLWESTVPRHASLEEKKKTALEKQAVVPTATSNFDSIYGLLLVVGETLVAPDLSGGLIGFDCASGKVLWKTTERDGLTTSWNMPAHLHVGKNDYIATVNRTGRLRMVDVRDGKILWTHELRSLHLTHPVGSGDVLLVFESNPKITGADIGKQDKNNPALNYVGVLTAYRATETGPVKLWQLPGEIAHVLSLDAGPSRRVVARDGLVYYLTNPEKTAEVEGGGKKERMMHIIELATGKVLKSEPFPFGQFHVWGDRVVGMSDIQHRPRKANAEIWQFYSADPRNFQKLGGGWHINGPTPVHTATGGYELPLFDAFSDGFLFARTVQGIRCYDLRR